MYIAQGLRHRPAHRRAAGQLWEKGGGAWDASCTMENPEARICCGPHDCGPLRIYDGTAEEISTGGWQVTIPPGTHPRSEEQTSELQSLMRISYAVCCLKKKTEMHKQPHT